MDGMKKILVGVQRTKVCDGTYKLVDGRSVGEVWLWTVVRVPRGVPTRRPILRLKSRCDWSGRDTYDKCL